MKINREFHVFLIVSGIQWLISYGTYIVTLQFYSWRTAFLCALAVGISLQTVLQFKATFKLQLTLDTGLRYVAYQLVYAVVNWLLLGAAIAMGTLEVVAPLLVLAIVTPVNFILTRLVINPKNSSA